MRRLAAAALALALHAGAAAAQEPMVALGVVRSDNKVEVKSKIASPIRRIPVEEGERVPAGGALVELVNDRERAEVDRARSELERARSALATADLQLTIARRELERNERVPDLITEKELEQSRDAVQVAEAERQVRRDDVARAQAQVAVADAALADTFINAPFPGVVSRIYLREGATPRVAETTLLDFQALDRLYVEVALPLQFLPRVRPGMTAAVIVEDEHSAIKARSTGTVRLVYPEVDAATRMFRAKLDLTPPDPRIQPGMFARVRLGAAGGAR